MYNPEFGATGGLPAQWARLGHPDLQVKIYRIKILVRIEFTSLALNSLLFSCKVGVLGSM